MDQMGARLSWGIYRTEEITVEATNDDKKRLGRMRGLWGWRGLCCR